MSLDDGVFQVVVGDGDKWRRLGQQVVRCLDGAVQLIELIIHQHPQRSEHT